MTKKKNNKIFSVLTLGLSITTLISFILGYHLLIGDQSFFLAGDTTHGHYQIELKCQACHGNAFSSSDIMQGACESCHAKELDKVNDSHPKSVFLDPRNAELLNSLDARYCVTCHREHKPEITRDYGVTLANDFCFHCHQDVGTNRPSHKEFEFVTCASSGCHNFHDNSMLYEKFISKHMNESINRKKQLVPERMGLKKWLKKHKLKKLPVAASADINQFFDHQNTLTKEKMNSITKEWSTSIHAHVETNCSSCHVKKDLKDNHLIEIDSVEKQCGTCHKKQETSFLQGKHGMRLSLGLSRMSTMHSKLEVDKNHTELLGCTSCHNPHDLDIKKAAVESCLNCHQDEHSFNYRQSKHFALWQKEQKGESPIGSGVSCATCHLPRIKKGRRVTVVHNQNLNLRPNMKMLRSVCMNCHGMEFSVSALSDKSIIKNNFSSAPKSEHLSFELIKQRMIQKKKLMSKSGEENEDK